MKHRHHRCRPLCQTCDEHGNCTSCVPGWFGSNCTSECHFDCFTCSRNSVCDTCRNESVYGELCKEDCGLCRNRACGKDRCRNGCMDGYYEWQSNFPGLPPYYSCEPCRHECPACESYNTCTRCIDRRWGEKCERQCPRGCDKCHQKTGECMKTQCDPGEYLKPDGQCQPCLSTCLVCTSEHKCTVCKGERYGQTCESANCTSIGHCLECDCASDACDSSEVRCLQCEDGYTGESCALQYDTSYSSKSGSAEDDNVNRASNIRMLTDPVSLWLLACVAVLTTRSL